MLADLLDAALSLVAPPVCVGCGCEPDGSRDVLCPDCRADLPLLGDCCDRCALPLPCYPCPAAAATWDEAVAACAHDGVARELVAGLKRSGARPIAAQMADLTAVMLDPRLLSGAAVVAVPPHPARRRSSGVDHAFEFARCLASLTGRPLTRNLRRSGAPHRQATSTRATRLDPGRIRVSSTGSVPASCLLVDDVHTTGATLEACSRALREAGAESIVCVTFTRATTAMSDGPMAAGW